MTTKTASDLCPGDIATREDGTRWFAAFDVDRITDGFTGEPAVRVWTAVADQDAGMPREFVVPAHEIITVR